MSRQVPAVGLGLFGVIPVDALRDVGVGTFDSDYTEAGPIPGRPVPEETLSRWQPSMVGAQSVGLTVGAIRPGYPGIEGARVIYRLEGDTAFSDWRGWNEPNLPTNWTAPDSGWNPADPYAFPAACALPGGKVAVIAPVDGADDMGQSWIYNARTEGWTDGLDWSTGDGLEAPVAIAYDPMTSRLIKWSGSGNAGTPTQRAHYSEDEGLTWSLYSRGMWPVTVAGTDRIRVVVDPRGGDWLAVVGTEQCVSSDRGGTFRSVGTLTGASGTTAYVPARTGAGWLIGYINTADNFPCVRLLPVAASTFASFKEVVVEEEPAGDLVITTDEDGIVYLVTRGTDAETTRQRIKVHRSLDGGNTWRTYLWAPDLGDNARILALQDLVAANGQLHLCYTQGGGSSAQVTGTVALITLGGWSQVEHGTGASAAAGSDPLGRSSFGNYNNGGDSVGITWIPYALPDNMGWTSTIDTAVKSFASTVPGLRITTTGGQEVRYSYKPSGLAVLGYVAGEAIVRPTVSSASINEIGVGGDGPFIEPELGNGAGTVQYRPRIVIARDGIRVLDGSTPRSTALFDTTASPVHLRWILRPAHISVWYRTQDDPVEIWTRLSNDDEVTTSGTSSLAGLAWGHGPSADGDVFWRLVGSGAGAEWLYAIGGDTADSTDRVPGLRWGRPIPGPGIGGYPLSEATATGEDLGRLVSVGGPIHTGEQVSVPVAYEHGIEHIHPGQSPSPRAYWQAGSDADQVMVYGLGTPMFLGGAFGLVALRVRCREIELQTDDGAGGLGPVLTMSMALCATFAYDRVGRVLIPAVGTVAVDRFIGENELVGGWVEVETSGDPEMRVITENTQGYLTSDTSVQQVFITIAALDGTELDEGTGAVYHHSAVHVVYPDDDVPRQYVRIRIPEIGAGGGVPRAGILTPVRIVGFGSKPIQSWTRTLELAKDVREAPDGSEFATQTGPGVEVWSYPFTDGIDMQAVRTLSNGEADWVGAAGGVPIGTRGDTWLSMWAHAQTSLKSGQTPCVFFPRLPTTTGTIFDPTLYLYGNLTAKSISVTCVVGRDGIDEWVRMDAPTIRQRR